MSILQRIKNLFQKNDQGNTINTNDRLMYSTYTNQKYYIDPNVFSLSGFGHSVPDAAAMYEVYDKDAHFYSCFETLFDKVLSLDWNITGYVPDNWKGLRGKNKTVYNYIKRQFKNIDTTFLMRRMLDSLITGKQIFQIIYKEDDNGNIDVSSGYYEIDHIEDTNPDYFDFKYPSGDLYYFKNKTYGEKINLSEDYPYQFFTHTHKKSYINPHGESVIGKRGYTLYLLKTGVLKDYAIIHEMYASPNLVANVKMFDEEGKEIIKQKDYNDILSNVKNKIFDPLSSGKNVKVVKANNFDLEFMTPPMDNMLDLESSFEMYNREISKMILGSTKVNEGTETTGSYSQSEVHEQTTEAKVESACKEIEITINAMIKMLVDLNFGKQEGYPEFSIEYRENVVDMDEYERMVGWFDRGLDISKDSIYEKYGITPPDPNKPEDSLQNSNTSDVEIIDETIVESDDNNELDDNFKKIKFIRGGL